MYEIIIHVLSELGPYLFWFLATTRGYQSEGVGIDCPGNTYNAIDVCYECCVRRCNKADICIGFVYSLDEKYTGSACQLKEEPFCEVTTTLENTVAYRKGLFCSIE